ncbi:MAG: serine/threonine-protein kinase [Bacteroidales bacterium]|nr:serine/threonine-protein kinase [Clostridium sp.]MCM1204983.1 serine/threonine-protein kinase [Bacteroidales bacterium]
MEVNNLHLCIGCMRELHSMDVCQYCGLVQRDYIPTPRCLIPGTRLSNRYVIGKILGEGSFGITYIGWDEVLAFPVAVKEYYPSDLVSRDVIRGNDTDVYMYANIEETEYRKKLDRFLKEARDLTRFNQFNAIVSVRDFFFENNTAYIVMDYIRGESLKAYVKREGAIDAGEVLRMFKPVLESLAKVHDVGIIHRDISPDNLLFDEEHNLVLIDFGSAELQNVDLTRSVTIMFKRGFSPEEQYRSYGKQGAWTDIYAICATMYYAMTASIPDEAIQRAIEDRVVSLWEYRNINLSNEQMKAIMKGMKIRAEERYQNVRDLHAVLYKIDEKSVSPGYSKKYGLIAVMLGVIAVLGCWIWNVEGKRNLSDGTEKQIVITEEITDAEEATDTEESTDNEEPSRQSEYRGMISCIAETKDSALEQLNAMGKIEFIIEWEEDYSSTVKEGCIIGQSIAAGTLLECGEKYNITFTVSKGEKPIFTGKISKTTEANQMTEAGQTTEINSSTEINQTTQEIMDGYIP